MDIAIKNFNDLPETDEIKRYDPGAIGIFRVKSANDWISEARGKPIPRALFKTWWYEGETLILFGPTNVGKSVLAMQAADQISTDMKVLYVDLELSEHHLLNRFGDYHFSENLIRVEINRDSDVLGDNDWEKLILESIVQVVEEHGTKVLFVDNITWLNSELDKGKFAISLMRKIKQIKNKYGLSLCVVAHTVKRDSSRELSFNDVGGSSHLANFADSIIGINYSAKDESVRYVKQLKTRYVEKENHGDNVWVATLEKLNGCLKLEHSGYGPESDYLKPYTENERAELEQTILYLHRTDPDLSYQQIAERAGCNRQKVYRTIKCNGTVTRNNVTLQTPKDAE